MTSTNTIVILLYFVNIFIIVKDCNEKPMTSHNTDMPEIHSNNDNKKPRIFKRKRKDLLEISNVEEELRIQRLKQIMNQEEQLADIKFKHEERIAIMKEDRLKECVTICK